MVQRESHAIHMGTISTIKEEISPSYIRQRGLFESTTTDNSNSPLSLNTSLNTRKRWRWWDYMAVLFGCIAFIEMVVLLTNAIVLSLASSPVTFSKLSFFFISLFCPTQLYHFLKQFKIIPRFCINL